MNDQLAKRSDGDAFAPSFRELPAMPGTGTAGLAMQGGLGAEAILAGISDGLIALDNEWRSVYGHPEAQFMWGRDLDPVIGKTIHEVLDIGADNPFSAVYS